jgi:hypothetical protein
MHIIQKYEQIKLGADGFAFGWGIAPQAGSSRVRIPIMSLECFIDLILRPRYGPEMRTRVITWW